MDYGADISVEVVGYKNLERLMHKIIEINAPLEEYFLSSVRDMETFAKINCPVDTGELRDSIHIQGKYPYFIIVADAINVHGQHYAMWVHEGTSKMPPRPFIRNAVVAVMADLPKVLRLKLKEYMRE